MTYTAKLEKNPEIALKDFYDQNVGSTIDDDFYIENKAEKKNSKGIFKKSFGNQLTFKSIHRKYNVKIFYNSNIQVTGVKSIEDVEYIQSKMETILESKIINIKRVMKNVVAKLSMERIHLYQLYDSLKENQFNCNYTPEVYPGCKLKINKSTALVFGTGSVIISTGSDDNIDTLMETLIAHLPKQGVAIEDTPKQGVAMGSAQ
jgi:TATA-box binding protein (TBP) (component of TFIID and TFIIIB)